MHTYKGGRSAHLHLHTQRPGALHGHCHSTARWVQPSTGTLLTGGGHEEAGGVGDTHQAALPHLKHTHLQRMGEEGEGGGRGARQAHNAKPTPTVELLPTGRLAPTT